MECNALFKSGEFYSEYGSFDVSITLPKNYVISATGDLQSPKEIDFLNQLAENTKQNLDKYRSKKQTGYRNNSFPKSDNTYKTVRFFQKNVHDFAWFADKKIFSS